MERCWRPSCALAVGFIALAGVAAEFGVIMLLDLKHARDARIALGKLSMLIVPAVYFLLRRRRA